LKGSKDMSGIAFESPAYLLVTQFRYIVSNPVKKACVAYRKSMSADRVSVAADQLKKEGIQLVLFELEGAAPSPASIQANLKDTLEKTAGGGSCDLFWVVLDPMLVNGKALQEIWLPATAEAKIPFLVEADSLLQLKGLDKDFGSFGVMPNLVDMAGQAVQQIESILKDGAKPEEVGVESVVSVDKILNKGKAESSGVKVKSDNLSGVKVLE
jgi:ABC-type uncharacterized transport system substrate-binding protein